MTFFGFSVCYTLPSLTPISPYLGFPVGKLQKCQFLRPARVTSWINIPEIHRVYVQLQSPPSFKIWSDLVHKSGIYNWKTVRRSFLLKILEAPSQKLGVRSQNNCIQKKWYGRPLSICQVWRRSVYARRQENENKSSCVSFFVCLSHWAWPILVSQSCRNVRHFNEVSFAIYWSIFAGFGMLLEEEI